MNELLSLKAKLAIGVGVVAVAIGGYFAMSHDLKRGDNRVATLIAQVPLAMWSATALDANGKELAETHVCADPLVRQGFELPLPKVNGSACLMVEQPVVREGRFDGRCKVGALTLVVNSSRTGDPASDFTVRMRTQALAMQDPGVLQIIRYRKLGPCPAGWHAGQAVNPGTGKTYDALDTRM
ncbi:MAG: hypothetical protein BGN86_13570 [Caulobacterales bacterium 68-7]|nr:MAG: hypothetical protein BGN86_13570 [Caulobacterales bacterium 68-7]